VKISENSSFSTKVGGGAAAPRPTEISATVAMHWMGYPYFQRKTEFGSMEFGITFSAIYRDLKMQHGEDIADNFFLESRLNF
jgi:hypothetical protein